MRVEIAVTGAPEAATMLKGIGDRLDQPMGPLLEKIASTWETGFQKNFEDQGSALGPWLELRPKTNRLRVWTGFPPVRPILVRTNDLMQSIRLIRQDESSVTVGTDLEYAAIQQFGGVEDAENDIPGLRTIPPRPFVVLSPELIEEPLGMMDAYFFGEGAHA